MGTIDGTSGNNTGTRPPFHIVAVSRVTLMVSCHNEGAIAGLCGINYHETTQTRHFRACVIAFVSLDITNIWGHSEKIHRFLHQYSPPRQITM